VRSFLDKNEIGVGEKVKITVKMEWEQQEDSSIVVTQITPPSSVFLKQIDSRQRTSSRLEKNEIFAERVLEYVYIGKEKGAGDIAPVLIEYTTNDNPENKRIIKGEPIPIKVIPKVARFEKMALKSFFAVAAVFLLFGVFMLFKKRVLSSREDKRKNIDKDNGSLEKNFCEKLKELNKHKVAGDVGAYYAGIEKSLLDYVKEKYNSDLSAESMGKLPAKLQKICAECKSMSEKIRFSGYKPQENEQNKLIRGITKYMKSLMRGESEEEPIETIN